MKPLAILFLALALAPAAALAQGAPPPIPAGAAAPSAQQIAAMQQMHAQFEQLHVQFRGRMLAALTPQHRATVANIVGQLALSPNPDLRAAAQELDAVFVPAEKQAILSIDAAERANARALMQQHRAAFEAALPADQRAQMAQREAKMQAFMQSRSRQADFADAGAIVLRTLGNIGGGIHGRPF